VPSTTVSSCPYLDYDGTVAVCSGDHTDDDGWTTVQAKNKKGKDPVDQRKPQDPRKAKDSVGFSGIELVEQEIYGIASAPVGYTARSIPAVVLRNRRHQRPKQ
jgi:hypothetical protein